MPGNRIRRYREQRGLSVRELARRSGLSPSQLSQVERGLGDPSISALRRIAEALGVSVFYLLDEDEHAAGAERLVVRRAARRRVVLPGSGLEYELLCPDVRRQMEVFIGRLAPGASTAPEPRGHASEECVLVLEGVMELVYGDELVRLEAGDSAYIDGRVPHGVRAGGDEPLVFLSALTPPSL